MTGTSSHDTPGQDPTASRQDAGPARGSDDSAAGQGSGNAVPKWLPIAAIGVLLVGLLLWSPWSGGPDESVTGPTAAPTPTITGSRQERVSARPYLMFEDNNVYVQEVTDAPVHASSDAMIQTLIKDEISPHFNGVAGFNAYDYYGSFWVAEAGTPKVDVKFDDCQGKGGVPEGLLDGEGHFLDVPIPPDAVPAQGDDQHLAVWSPSLDRLWEFWITTKNPDGSWSACWGGRIDSVSQNPGFFDGTFGASASGLAFSGYMISVEEAKALHIGHSIGLNLIEPADWQTFSWPAQRSDGWGTGPNKIAEGARLRLDPSVDVDSLDLSPLGKAIARATQQYGFIVVDKAGAVAVVAEGGDRYALANGGGNPWKQILDGEDPHKLLDAFPWDKVEVLEYDWGKPSDSPADSG